MEDSSSRPLTDGKSYHFNVIYNHALSQLSSSPDNERALEFIYKVVETLSQLGFNKSYFHDRDCLPGRNVFGELFRVLEESEHTIVVMTPGFVANCWPRYTQMATFRTLLEDGKTQRFIPVSLGVDVSDIPQELITEHVLFFSEDWSRDDNAWQRLTRVFAENLPVVEVNRSQALGISETLPVEETVGPADHVADVFDGDDNRRQNGLNDSDTEVALSDDDVRPGPAAGETRTRGRITPTREGQNDLSIPRSRSRNQPSSGFTPSDNDWIQGETSRDVTDFDEIVAEVTPGPIIRSPPLDQQGSLNSIEDN